MENLEQQYNNWIKLREISIDVHNQKLCYCGHTYKCECADPDMELFKGSVERGTIKLNNHENGWSKYK